MKKNALSTLLAAAAVAVLFASQPAAAQSGASSHTWGAICQDYSGVTLRIAKMRDVGVQRMDALNNLHQVTGYTSRAKALTTTAIELVYDHPEMTPKSLAAHALAGCLQVVNSND